MSIIFAGVGALFAAVGSAVLLTRCFRGPRGDLIAWSVALLALLVSLGSQTLGYLSGFHAATFRAMELGGQVIAPLALTLGLCEVAAKSTAARFCARLYIPSLALVATVVLLLDQLAPKTFTKAWPDPAVYYQTPPDYVLMFAIGPVVALVSLIAMATVVRRSGEPGWNAVLRPQLLAGAAAFLLAYPSLAQLARYEAHIHLPTRSGFSLLCAAAAALAWLAGTRIGELPLDTLRGTAGRRGSGSSWQDADQRIDLDPYRGGVGGTAARNLGRDVAGQGWHDEEGPGRRAQDGHGWAGEEGPGWRAEDGHGWHDEADHGWGPAEPAGGSRRADQRYESAGGSSADS